MDLFMIVVAFALEHGRELVPGFLAAFVASAAIVGVLLAAVKGVLGGYRHRGLIQVRRTREIS